jgi:hypothetical protein
VIPGRKPNQDFTQVVFKNHLTGGSRFLHSIKMKDTRLYKMNPDGSKRKLTRYQNALKKAYEKKGAASRYLLVVCSDGQYVALYPDEFRKILDENNLISPLVGNDAFFFVHNNAEVYVNRQLNLSTFTMATTRLFRVMHTTMDIPVDEVCNVCNLISHMGMYTSCCHVFRWLFHKLILPEFRKPDIFKNFPDIKCKIIRQTIIAAYIAIIKEYNLDVKYLYEGSPGLHSAIVITWLCTKPVDRVMKFVLDEEGTSLTVRCA